MKKIMIALGLVFTLATTNAHALDHKTINSILQTFTRHYANAKDVKWSDTDEFLVIRFRQEGDLKFAYYNRDKELVVLAQPITADKLPSDLRVELENKYTDYSVVDIYLIKDQDGYKYSAVALNDKFKLLLNSNNKKWEVLKKTTN